MKTRVVRYWHQTDWLYKVEAWAQVTEKDKFITIGGHEHSVVPEPKIGEWRWRHIRGAVSRDLAMRIAQGLSEPNADDVVAEFGT